MVKVICYLVCTVMWSVLVGFDIGALIAFDDSRTLRICNLVLHIVLVVLYGIIVVTTVKKLL